MTEWGEADEKVTTYEISRIMMEEKKWYAVYTKPHCEKKVADILTRKGIENYCPFNKVLKQWSDRKKIIFSPLFSSYVFVRISTDEHLIVRQTYGILNFIYWLNRPAVVRDQEIEIIKKFLNEHSFIKLEKIDLNIDDVVKINSGPLVEQEGKVVSIKSKTVKVVLPSLGYLMYAEIETTSIKVLKKNSLFRREIFLR